MFVRSFGYGVNCEKPSFLNCVLHHTFSTSKEESERLDNVYEAFRDTSTESKVVTKDSRNITSKDVNCGKKPERCGKAIHFAHSVL